MMFYLILYDIKKKQDLWKLTFWGVVFFRKIYAEILYKNSKIKNAEQDLHQLTKCYNNGLFVKTNGTEILKT